MDALREVIEAKVRAVVSASADRETLHLEIASRLSERDRLPNFTTLNNPHQRRTAARDFVARITDPVVVTVILARVRGSGAVVERVRDPIPILVGIERDLAETIFADQPALWRAGPIRATANRHTPAALAVFLRRAITINFTALTARRLLVGAEALIEGGLPLISACRAAHLTAL